MTDDLAKNYARTFNTQVGFGVRPALLLVDFCQAYFEPSCDLYADVQDALESALRVRVAARAHAIPVIFTHVVYHASGLNGGRFFEKAAPLRHFIEGNPLGGWPDGLVPLADELVISKQYPSAFFGTSLASTLVGLGVDSVLLGGLTTSGCVRATCVDAMSHGFRTSVIAEACGDRHSAPHTANLFDMNAKYADVVSETEVLAFLSGL